MHKAYLHTKDTNRGNRKKELPSVQPHDHTEKQIKRGIFAKIISTSTFIVHSHNYSSSKTVCLIV